MTTNHRMTSDGRLPAKGFYLRFQAAPMTLNVFFRYTLPALLMGVLGGYLVSSALSAAPSPYGKARTGAKQQALASSQEASDGAVDYRKLAYACLAAAQQQNGSNPRGGLQAALDPASVQAAQEELDRVLSLMLEKGQWTESAGRHTRSLMEKLPPAEAVAFTDVLRAAVASGELEVQFGAWFPVGQDRDLNN